MKHRNAVASRLSAWLAAVGLLLVTGCPPAAPVVDGLSDEPAGGGGPGGAPGGVDGGVDGGGDAGGGGGDGDGGSDGDGGEPNEPVDLSGEFSGKPQRLGVYRDALTREEAWHLLRRTSFGATEQEVQAAMERGLQATVDDLLSAAPLSQELQDLLATYENDTARRWLTLLIETPNPLHERMALFWHDRFATSRRVATDYRQRTLPNKHMDLLRKHALGDYRQFLAELTLDPLMLLWLNGAESPKENPNENYAREFWELFTLGRDVLYTEDDIKEGALAFTGITLLYSNEEDPRPIFDLLHHDNGDKLVFPDRAAARNHDYLSIIDLTLAQPEAPLYVARNLFEFFVHDHPDDELLAQLAAYFVENDYRIDRLVRRILVSQALFSEDARFNQIVSPVEHYISFARTLDMHMYSEDSQTWRLQRAVWDTRDAGQELLNPAGVEGWTEGEAWLADQWVQARVEALGRTMEFGPDHTDRIPYHLLPPVSSWAEREVRKEIVRALGQAFHLDLSEAEEDIYVEVLDQNGYTAFHLINPDAQPQHIFEVMRLMAMDERFMTR